MDTNGYNVCKMSKSIGVYTERVESNDQLYQLYVKELRLNEDRTYKHTPYFLINSEESTYSVTSVEGTYKADVNGRYIDFEFNTKFPFKYAGRVDCNDYSMKFDSFFPWKPIAYSDLERTTLEKIE